MCSGPIVFSRTSREPQTAHRLDPNGTETRLGLLGVTVFTVICDESVLNYRAAQIKKSHSIN